MSGISRLVSREELPDTRTSNAPGFPYSFKLSFFGTQHDNVWQPPVWPSDKVGRIGMLLGLERATFAQFSDDTRVIAVFPATKDDMQAVDAMLRNDETFRPNDPLPPSFVGRLLAPSELNEYRIPRTPRALYRAGRLADYSFGCRGDTGTALEALPAWDDSAIRYVGETFGSAVFFRRIRDSQVMVVQIDHDEKEIEVLRQMVEPSSG